MKPAPYNLDMPKTVTSCAIFNSPHSGADYTVDFVGESSLPLNILRSSEDAFVDRLISIAPQNGAPMLAARFPRAYVDANRAADELDPALIRRAPPQKTNPRIMAGLGVIPRVVAEGRVIRPGKIAMKTAQDRLTACYYPYHAALKGLISAQKARFGHCVLFDFHSMPHSSISTAPAGFGRRPQIVLGDRFGVSCDSWVMETAYDLFRQAGFRVARNAPFAGGYITSHYGKPPMGVHVLQIEIDRSLYMDETLVTPNDGFDDICAQIGNVVTKLARISPNQSRIAAE